MKVIKLLSKNREKENAANKLLARNYWVEKDFLNGRTPWK